MLIFLFSCRSDIFVGFFGQRYGWHGLNDSSLQATFDAAVPHYPWLEKYRDRSVTELEFLHGHLNNPQKVPAILCFRHKEYDDKMRSIGIENGDKRQVYKYSSESEEAAERMKDLMKRVKATEDRCQGVNLAYCNPVEGAQWMFERVWEYLTQVLQKPFEASKLTRYEQELQQHNLFMDKMCALYHELENFTERLDEKILKDESQLLVITGEHGIGKSALICNWLQKQISLHSTKTWMYHFIGCTAESRYPNDFMRRVIWTLQHKINSLRADNININIDELETKSGVELINEYHSWLKKASESGLEVILVVDCLKGILYESKITKPLFWLPKDIPSGIQIILLTDITDKMHLEKLSEFQCDMLELEKLPSKVSVEICKDLLRLRGKTLSGDQLQQIVSTENVGNPLFLKVVIEELCMFGKFRELDNKIQSLVGCLSISGLFIKSLERLEQDYDPAFKDGSMTEKVMSSLCLSRKGLTENELSEMFGIESYQWLPFYYAIEPFLNRLTGGFLKLLHEPLAEAILCRYLKTEEKKNTFRKQQIQLYEKSIEARSNLDHACTELLWLCHQANEKTLIKKHFTNLSIFLKVFNLEPYKLLEYLDFMGLTKEELIEELSCAVNAHNIQLYSESIEEDLIFDFNTGEALVLDLESVTLFLNMAKSSAQEIFLLRLKKILENNEKIKDRDVRLHVTLYNLACFYVDIREDKKAFPLHESALEFFINVAPKSNINLEHLGRSYHGTGTVYTKLSEFDKAVKLFEKSIEIHGSISKSYETQINIAKSLSCIAEVHSLKGNFELAYQKYEEVVAMENSLYTLYVPPEMSYSLTNLGICYRRLQLFDKAEDVYNRALKIKSNALGENHVDVGYAYFNLGNLANDKGEVQVALVHFEHALDIFDKVNYLESIDAVFLFENMAKIYMVHYDKAIGLPYYWFAFNYLEKHNQMEVGDAFVHLNYLRHLLATNDYAGTRRVARAMIHCPKMQHFLPYLFLDYVNRLYLSIDPSDEPCEESIDHGIQLFPDSIALPAQKIELNLVPNRNLDLIKKTLEFYYDHAQDKDARLIEEALKHCHNAGWTAGADDICEYWSDRRPDLKESLLSFNSKLKKD